MLQEYLQPLAYIANFLKYTGAETTYRFRKKKCLQVCLRA